MSLVATNMGYCLSFNSGKTVAMTRALHCDNRKKPVYHTVNGDHALFHTSKTAKIIKVILLRAPCQNVNVLLSNITFIIFAVFDV